MERLELVEAGPEDVPAMAAMTEALIAEEGGGPRAPGAAAAELTEHMAAGFRAVLFRLAGALAGYAMFLATPKSTFLNHFFVVPAHRRGGLGRAAFARLQAEFFAPALPVTLSVMDSNPGGIAFWQALGFRQTSVNMERAP